MDSVVFILVGTTHAGNLGATARAIRTMGFTSLRLVDTVSPRREEALARASGAQPVLESAGRFNTLAEAIADCRAVFGTSARQRHLSVPLLSCREACEAAAGFVSAREASTDDRVAFVFGRERSGLTNEELDLCTRHLHIPTDPDFSSLNLGAAVQVVAYELAMALADSASGVARAPAPAEQDALADSAAMAHLHAHLERVMINTGFLDPERPRHLMRRLKRYFERNRPTENELAILRGILAATEAPRPPEPRDDR